jgi:hypothetical protein
MSELKVYMPRDGRLSVNQQNDGVAQLKLWKKDSSQVPLPQGTSQIDVKAGECLRLVGDTSTSRNMLEVEFSYWYVS